MSRHFVNPIAQQINDFENSVWAMWTPTGASRPNCLRCARPAACLHEIVPRSVYRSSVHEHWYEDIDNSVPLCNNCHQLMHKAGKAGRVELRRLAKQDR